MKKPFFCTVFAALLAFPGVAKADVLAKGSPAPKFTLKDSKGNAWNSDDYVGKKTVVMFFFPAALTGR